MSLMLAYGVSAVQAANLTLGTEDTLSVNYSESGSLQDLENGSLQLNGGTTLLLTYCGEGDGKSYTLLTGVSGLFGADGSAITLNEENNDASLYFDATKPGSGFWAAADLLLVNGALQLQMHNEDLKDTLTITEQHTTVFGTGADLQYYTGILAENVTASEYDSGGAIYDGDDITLSNNGSVSFSGNLATGYGGAICGVEDITLSNNGSVAFNGNSASEDGGAISGQENITLSNNGSVSFSGNSALNDGGAIDGSGTITLHNNGSVAFSGNSAAGSSYGYGGAINGSGDITLSNNVSVVFSDNSASSPAESYGGAIAGWGIIALTNNGSITFSGNTATSDAGAIYGNYGLTVTLSGNSSVLFSGNSSSGHGGAIESDGVLSIINNRDVSFKENSSRHGGALAVYTLELNQNESVLFENNQATSTSSGYGGAIYAAYGNGSVTMNGNGSVTFKDNVSETNGGAIYMSSYEPLELCDNGNVSFTGNSTKDGGGAICANGAIILKGNESVTFSDNSATQGGAIYSNGDLELSDNGSVVFSGNKSIDTTNFYGGALKAYEDVNIHNNDSVLFEKNLVKSGNEYRLRSIYFLGSVDTFALSAGEGQIVEFRDTLYIDIGITFDLNAHYNGKAQSGDILFTGKYTKAHLNELLAADKVNREATNTEIRNSRTTEVATTTNLLGGRLRVEYGAVYKCRDITVAAGSGATLRVKSAKVDQKNYELTLQSGTTLELAGSKATISANKINFEQGSALTFKLSNENTEEAIFTLDAVLNFQGAITLNLGLEESTLSAGLYKLMDLKGKGVPEKWNAKNLMLVSDYFDYDQLQWIGDTLYLNNGRNLVAAESDTPVTPDEPVIPDTPVTPDEPVIPDTPVTPDEPVVDNTVRPSGNTLSASDVPSNMDLVLDGKGTLTLTGEVNAASILVDNSKNLTLKSDKSEGGSLSGDADLVKRNRGTLTLNDGNSSWTGDTHLQAGTIKVKGVTSFGKGDVYVKGGTLNLGSKAIANDIIQSKTATIKSGKKFAGTYMLKNGELQKGSTLNISKTAILAGGTVNGTLSGAGTTTVTGKVTLGNKGKITTKDLVLGEGAMLATGTKGLSSKTTALTVGGGSELSLSGKLNAGSLTLQSGASLTMNGKKPVTLKVKGALTLNEGSSIILNCNFVQGKTYKLLTFGNYAGVTDVEMLYDIFGVEKENGVLVNTGKAITLTVTGDWEPQKQQMPVAAAAAVATEPVVTTKPQTSPVADALVQANWGQLEASRAFVNAMANRSMAVQLGNGERAVWASAIGSSSRHDTASGHNGADTNVSGGAFGLETQVGRASLFGLALGNSWTRVSAHGFGTIEQDTTHLGVYGQTNWRSGMTADWSAAYGRSESESMGSDWSQKHLQLDGRVSYNHELNARTVLSPFAGVQYYASDSAAIGTTDTGSLQNLRAEIGVGASHRTGKLGVYGEIALHQDLARNNPTVSMEGVRYTGMNPGRTGINFTIGASYELSDKWSVNASYTGEFVENANAHSASVGASYKF